MNAMAWAGVCKACGFTKAGPTRAEVVFAIEKHARFTGHLAWDVTKVQPVVRDAGAGGTPSVLSL